MSVELVESATDELAAAIDTLLPQLSQSATALSRVELEDLLSQPGVFLLVYRGILTEQVEYAENDCATTKPHAASTHNTGSTHTDESTKTSYITASHTAAHDLDDTQAGEQILGMLTLATFRIPTGKRAWIEDVVVDGRVRGQGAGRQLVEAALAHAKQIGCRTVDLTSRPSRQAANRLYQKCGFQARDTNIYRYTDN